LATSSLEVINFTERILIDGVLVELKIIVEWGFTLGEDACLLEEDDVFSKASIPDNNFDNEIHDIQDNVADLENNLVEDWAGSDKAAASILSPSDTVGYQTTGREYSVRNKSCGSD
jgi:hypothetical protein